MASHLLLEGNLLRERNRERTTTHASDHTSRRRATRSNYWNTGFTYALIDGEGKKRKYNAKERNQHAKGKKRD